MGGACIYCGLKGSKEHLEICKKYKEARNEEEREPTGREEPGDKAAAVTNKKRPPPETPVDQVVMACRETTTVTDPSPFLPNPHTIDQQHRVTPPNWLAQKSQTMQQPS